MTSPGPILWLFLHRSGKRGGVIIETWRGLDIPQRIRCRGRVYAYHRHHFGRWMTATYSEDIHARREAAEEVGG